MANGVTRRPPDLVLLDIGMPDQDGLVVLREVRRHSDVPVLMMTARDEVADKVGAPDLCCYDDLCCDLGTREVTRAGRRIELTTIEFDLLAYLVRTVRRVQSRELLPSARTTVETINVPSTDTGIR
ncbi:MAG: response regulator transcription factor [Micromonosporaceae bacterium]